MLGVCRVREIRQRITSRMDLLERGLHAGLVGGTKAEGDTREVRSARGVEEKDKAITWIYHSTVLSGNLRQAVCQATKREGKGCLLPYE